VFKYLWDVKSDDFFIFLITGKIIFLWFSKSVSSAANCLFANRGLINQRVIPKIIFPMADIQQTFYKQIFVFMVLLGLLALNGHNGYNYWWQAIVLTLLLYILIAGLAFIFTIMVTYVPDFNTLIQMLMMGLMFSSGIFFDINTIADPAIKEAILTYNPLALIIDGYRQALMYQQLLNWTDFLPAFYISMSLCVTGAASLFMLSSKLTKRLFV
jgi:lipopolysaccharide transport system permease protein